MSKVKDPVCGMELESEKAAATMTHQGQTYHFCSPMCKSKFTMNPSKYTGAPAEPDHTGHGHGHG
ncbi:MAG TPA: YHS domain-containing protein [Symbiobacteriaceae bacterium]|jgi:Cu+-exporting ATPase